ncbi:hypothetical protein JB92DRAFT_3031112 [Gautieria morchelliformis]|nr:hypothetical protein JB92DRAFT_3031112 [Gautieria morchelliformis]
MPNVFRFLLDKSIKFHAQHKELPPRQLSELKISSSRLAADPHGNFPSFSSVSSIDHSNQVSPSPSDLELDCPNLLHPASAPEIGFPNQSPSPCTSHTDRPTESLHPPPRGNHFLDLVTPVNPPTRSGSLKKILSALRDMQLPQGCSISLPSSMNIPSRPK